MFGIDFSMSWASLLFLTFVAVIGPILAVIWLGDWLHYYKRSKSYPYCNGRTPYCDMPNCSYCRRHI